MVISGSPLSQSSSSAFVPGSSQGQGQGRKEGSRVEGRMTESDTCSLSGKQKDGSSQSNTQVLSQTSTESTTGPAQGTTQSSDGCDLSSRFFASSVMRIAVGNICGNIGWNSVGSASLDVLSEVVVRYMKGIGKSCMSYANEASRSECNLEDLELSFKKHGINLHELEEYLTTVEPIPFPVKVPKFPAVIRPMNRIQRGCLDITEEMWKEIKLNGGQLLEGRLDSGQLTSGSNSTPGGDPIPDLNMAREMIDTVIGYADTSSEEEEEGEEDGHEDVDLSDDIGSGDHLERINMNSITGGFTLDTNERKSGLNGQRSVLNLEKSGLNGHKSDLSRKVPKKKEGRVMKRSEYYESWMPPLVPIILSESESVKRRMHDSFNNSLSINTTMDECGMESLGGISLSATSFPAPAATLSAATLSAATLSAASAAMVSPSKDSKTQYEVATIESSAQLTAVYLNKEGQIISLTGKEGRAPDPRMPPPDSDDDPSDEDALDPIHGQDSVLKSSENVSGSGMIEKFKLSVDGKKGSDGGKRGSEGGKRRGDGGKRGGDGGKRGSDGGSLGKIPKLKLLSKDGSKLKLGKMSKMPQEKKDKGIKINIGKHKVTKAKDNLEKLQKMRKEKLLKNSHETEKTPKLKLLSIKVSGLKSGTPTASPKVPEGFSWSKDSTPLFLTGNVHEEELDLETEERINSTIDDVLAGVSSSKTKGVSTDSGSFKKSAKGKKAPKECKGKVPNLGLKKKPTSKEIIEDDSDSNEEDGTNPIKSSDERKASDDSNSVFKFTEEDEEDGDLAPRKKSPLRHKSTPSPSRKGKSPRGDHAHHNPGSSPPSPVRGSHSHNPPGLASPSKAAKKLYPAEESNRYLDEESSRYSADGPSRYSSPEGRQRSPQRTPVGDLRSEAQRKKEDDEFDAAKILMSMSTTPTGSQSSVLPEPPTSSPFDTSAFNLGKQLASLNPSAAAAVAAAAAAGTGSTLHPFAPPPPPKLPFKTLAEKKAFIDTSQSLTPSFESDLKQEKSDRVSKKDKKKKEKKKEKSSSKKKRIESSDSGSDSDSKSNIPKLNIKISSSKELKKGVKSPKIEPCAKSSCVLITETVGLETCRKGSEGSMKRGRGRPSKSTGGGMKKKVSRDGSEEEGDKVWICPGCKEPDDGSPMIGCDNCDDWYHWPCVGIKSDPGDGDWFCPHCRDKQKRTSTESKLDVSEDVQPKGSSCKKRTKSGNDEEEEDRKEKKKIKKESDSKKHRHESGSTHAHSSTHSSTHPHKGPSQEGVKLKEKKKTKEWICPKCKKPDQTDCIMCDRCSLWFHFTCVGIIQPPKDDDPWYCSFCMKRMAKQGGHK